MIGQLTKSNSTGRTCDENFFFFRLIFFFFFHLVSEDIPSLRYVMIYVMLELRSHAITMCHRFLLYIFSMSLV